MIPTARRKAFIFEKLLFLDVVCLNVPHKSWLSSSTSCCFAASSRHTCLRFPWKQRRYRILGKWVEGRKGRGKDSLARCQKKKLHFLHRRLQQFIAGVLSPLSARWLKTAEAQQSWNCHTLTLSAQSGCKKRFHTVGPVVLHHSLSTWSFLTKHMQEIQELQQIQEILEIHFYGTIAASSSLYCSCFLSVLQEVLQLQTISEYI